MMLYWEHLCDENGQSLVWTSFLRPRGPQTSLHHPIHRRAIDFRLYHPDRNLAPGHVLAGIHPKVQLHDGDEYPLLDTMVDEFNKAFGTWLGTDMKEHQPIILHGAGMNFHGHMQCKPLGFGFV